jgi:hypothetical protein
MNAEELLEAATAEFEKTFSHVQMGKEGPIFRHVDGTQHDYIQVCSGGVRSDGEEMLLCDTPEEAIKSWYDSLQPFKGKKYLYWRIKPEIAQDKNERDFTRGGKVKNPTFGKWKVYSRFRVLD